MDLRLIAEIKKASPDGVVFQETLDVAQQAEAYTKLGASAISVVTAPGFQGDKNWIKQIRDKTHLPILRKDFLSSADDMKETRDLGADWVLLISDILTHAELDLLTFHANRVGLKPVVEVHSLYGLNNALLVDTNRILINNRNIRTNQLKILHTMNMISMIPDRYEITTASGYDTQPKLIEVTAKLQEIDYILIGKMLMTSNDLTATFKQILNLCQINAKTTSTSAQSPAES